MHFAEIDVQDTTAVVPVDRPGEPRIRDAWPMPEYAPLAGAHESRLDDDAFVERDLDASHASAGSFASIVLPAVLEAHFGTGSAGSSTARAPMRLPADWPRAATGTCSNAAPRPKRGMLL